MKNKYLPDAPETYTFYKLAVAVNHQINFCSLLVKENKSKLGDDELINIVYDELMIKHNIMDWAIYYYEKKKINLTAGNFISLEAQIRAGLQYVLYMIK